MGISVRESIIINTTPKRIFDILWDIDSYTKLFPEIKSASSKGSGKRKEAEFTADIISKVRYSLLLKANPPKEISWTLIKGDFISSNHGSWLIEKLADNKVRVTYQMEVETTLWVPKSILERLISKALPEMMKRLKLRAEGKNTYNC